MDSKIIKLIKKFPITIIKNSKQHKKAIRLLKKILFDKECALYAKLLAITVRHYEKQKYEKKLKLSEEDLLYNKAILAQKKGYLTKKESKKILQKWLGIKVRWSKEDQVFIAKSKKFPGIATHGNTPEKAKKEFMKCIELIIESE